MKRTFFLLSLCLILSSCEKSEAPRTYTEVTAEAPQAATPHSHADMTDPHAGMDMGAAMPDIGSSDPHAGYTKEQLAAMLQEVQGGSAAMKLESDSPLAWTVPEGWEEKTASGMRIASFGAKNDPDAIDCSIVTLGSGAGGLSGNIIRWLGQLNMPALSESDINAFVAKQEQVNIKGGQSALLLNFTTLQKNDADSTPSMLAAIIDTPQQRIFIKMTGHKGNVLKNLSAFKTLLESIEIR